MRRLLFILPLALSLAVPAPASAAGLLRCSDRFGLRDVELLAPSGQSFADLKDRAELSGVGYLGDDRLAVISNEAIGAPSRAQVQVFRRDGYGFVHEYDRPVFTGSDEGKNCRADIEGLAVLGNDVFVTPSFAFGRKKPEGKPAFDRGDIYKKCAIQKSVLRLGAIGAEKSITPPKVVLDIEATVKPLGVLAPFLGVPAKENGFDIEGLAVTPDRIYLGLRGPVLDPGLAIILVAERKPKPKPELRYVDLGGLGIRDIAAVGEEGFLLIAGPVGRGDGRFVLYSWTGRDGFPGASDKPVATPLCTLDSGAEGVAVRPRVEGGYEMIVVFDGSRLKGQLGTLPRPLF